MGQAQAQQTVLAVLLVTGGVVVWDSIKRTGKAVPPFKALVALTILGAFLAIGAGTVPEIAGPFALLVGLAIVISRVGVTA
jgi:hypothetical protein